MKKKQRRRPKVHDIVQINVALFEGNRVYKSQKEKKSEEHVFENIANLY